jgi:uncharacterized RDD family membrane protein YckC
LVLDLIPLSGFLALVAVFAPKFWLELGAYSRVLGGVVVIAHATLGGSPRSGGQTFGKRVVGIRVSTPQGSGAPLARSFMRSVVLWLPIVLAGLDLPLRGVAEAAWTVLQMLATSVPVCSAYLFIFNKPDFRCLHDLVAGTVVVRESAAAAPTDPFQLRHRIACGVIALLLTISPVFTRILSPDVVNATYDAVRNLPGVSEVQVTSFTSTFRRVNGASTTSSGLVVRVQSLATGAQLTYLQNRIASLALEHWEGSDSQVLTVEVAARIDLLLFRMNNASRMVKTVGGWRTSLSASAAP